MKLGKKEAFCFDSSSAGALVLALLTKFILLGFDEPLALFIAGTPASLLLDSLNEKPPLLPIES